MAVPGMPIMADFTMFRKDIGLYRVVLGNPHERLFFLLGDLCLKNRQASKTKYLSV